MKKLIVVVSAMVMLVGCTPTGWIAFNKDYCLGKIDRFLLGV
jgi:hypothetical protein